MTDKATQEKLAIRELLERYCDAVNQRSEQAMAQTWAEDAVWDLPHLDMGGLQGREAIMSSWVEAMKMFPFVNMMAMPGFIEVNGDTATMRCYTSEVAVMQDGTEIRPRGQYDDKCVKINGQWYFAHRKFTVLHGE
jgi:uncharacterized protein (TIGR02246 family)